VGRTANEMAQPPEQKELCSESRFCISILEFLPLVIVSLKIFIFVKAASPFYNCIHQ
jgi:hypothetical protein